MSSRFDYRSEEQFKRDIFFGTQVEKALFKRFTQQPQVKVEWYDDNGVGNDGQFIKSSVCTAGADYIATFTYQGYRFNRELLEVKWVPTAGKFTMKSADMRAYIREGANILYIYNSEKPSLKPNGINDVEKYIKYIENHSNQIRWGILTKDKVSKMMLSYEEKRIHYMGNKFGIVIPEQDYSGWFIEEQWH